MQAAPAIHLFMTDTWHVKHCTVLSASLLSSI